MVIDKRLVVSGLVFCSSVFCLELNPYYSYTLSQGYNFGSDIEGSFGNSIINDLGCRIKFNEKNSLLLLYSASYEGPGLKEEGGFTDRYQDHLLFALYKRKFSKALLKTRLDYVKSLSRSGVSEDWDSGDYNYNKLGFGLDLAFPFKNIDLGIGGKIADIKYPNYTYLLGSIDPEYDIPRYDNRMYKLSLSLGCLVAKMPIDASFEMLFRNYKNEYVKSDAGEDTKEKEKDKAYSLNGDISYPIAKNLTFGMDSVFSFLRSNYMEVKYNATGTVISAWPSFYNYNLIGFTPFISYGKNPKFNLSYSFEMKNFTNQKAEDENGNWLLDKRRDRTGIFLITACKPINKQISASISYSIKSLSSNMKRTGYNTTYNSLGAALAFEY